VKPGQREPWPGDTLSYPLRKGILFQRSADRGEIGAELTAHTVNSCDDRNRDTGGDKAVFDSCCAGFVGNKVLQNTLQLYLPGSCVGMAQQPENRR
jgi:hypothetical protein